MMKWERPYSCFEMIHHMRDEGTSTRMTPAWSVEIASKCAAFFQAVTFHAPRADNGGVNSTSKAAGEGTMTSKLVVVPSATVQSHTMSGMRRGNCITRLEADS